MAGVMQKPRPRLQDCAASLSARKTWKCWLEANRQRLRTAELTTAALASNGPVLVQGTSPQAGQFADGKRTIVTRRCRRKASKNGPYSLPERSLFEKDAIR